MDKEKLLEKVSKYEHWSYLLMSGIVAYQIVTPESIGGYVMTVICFFLVLRICQNISNRLMWIR